LDEDVSGSKESGKSDGTDDSVVDCSQTPLPLKSLITSKWFGQELQKAVKEQLQFMTMFCPLEPQFTLGKFEQNERLKGHKNFKIPSAGVIMVRAG
jgi:hypothetical protein